MCCLCDKEQESVNHLFFKCDYAAGIWHPILQLLGIYQQGQSFHTEKQIAVTKSHNKSKISRLYVMLFTKTVYAVWMQRNNKLFRGSHMTITHVMKDIVSKSLLDVIYLRPSSPFFFVSFLNQASQKNSTLTC